MQNWCWKQCGHWVWGFSNLNLKYYFRGTNWNILLWKYGWINSWTGNVRIEMMPSRYSVNSGTRTTLFTGNSPDASMTIILKMLHHRVFQIYLTLLSLSVAIWPQKHSCSATPFNYRKNVVGWMPSTWISCNQIPMPPLMHFLSKHRTYASYPSIHVRHNNS